MLHVVLPSARRFVALVASAVALVVVLAVQAPSAEAADKVAKTKSQAPAVAASAGTTAAPATSEVKDPDPSTVPQLARMMKLGVKPYYLGQRSGLDGWLLLKNGQIQFLYVPLTGTETVLGALFAADGTNISSQQLEETTNRRPEVLAAINGAIQQAQAQTQPPQPAAPTTAAVATAQGAVAAASATSGHEAASPGERLLSELDAATTVVIGNSSAPIVDMVMDTHCKHCQATWKQLREMVLANRLRLRFIPVANLDSDAERAAAILLRHTDPLNAWDKYVGGDLTPLDGKPEQATIDAVRANHALADRWKIDVTPYLVYRAKDGVVKIIKGELKQPLLLLTDLGV